MRNESLDYLRYLAQKITHSIENLENFQHLADVEEASIYEIRMSARQVIDMVSDPDIISDYDDPDLLKDLGEDLNPNDVYSSESETDTFKTNYFSSEYVTTQ